MVLFNSAAGSWRPPSPSFPRPALLSRAAKSRRILSKTINIGTDFPPSREPRPSSVWLVVRPHHHPPNPPLTRSVAADAAGPISDVSVRVGGGSRARTLL